MMQHETLIRAAPWQLSGQAIILIYRFPEAFVQDEGAIPPFLEGKFAGGWGTVMLVNYETSPVDAYQELLFVPGLFDVGRRWAYSITQIYVSSMASVVSGQENWGIPKQLADFNFEESAPGRRHISVSQNGAQFFEATVRSSDFRIPVTTRLLPFRPAIIQQRNNDVLLTQPRGSGWIGSAKLESLTVDERYFPNIEPFMPIVTINVANFTLTFPIPEVMAY